MRWFTWDLETGEIVNQGNSPPETAVLQARPGVKLVLNEYIDARTHKINPKTGRKIKIKQRHHALQTYDMMVNRTAELMAEIDYQGHKIGISDRDYNGWREVDDVFRVLQPSEYTIDTNSGELTVTREQWYELFGAVLRARQEINTRIYKEMSKCKSQVKS